MDANELHSVSISPLVTKSFALEWSQDNHVSVITNGGVHIFELVPHPTCIYPMLRFWRTFIYPSEFMPGEELRKFVERSLWKKEREEVIALLMQPSITPKIEDRKEMDPRIIKVAWSPVQMIDASKCLLAILTSAGSAEILCKFGNNWISLWNLSKFQYKIVKNELNLDATRIEKKELEKFAWHEHINRFLCTAICWSPIVYDIDCSPFAYVVAVFRSSNVVIFRVDHVSALAKVKEPIVVYETNLKSNVKISELRWIDLGMERHLIVIGYGDGRILGLRVVMRNGIFENEKMFKYHDHADRMIPSSIKCIKDKNNEERKIVLVTKNGWLFILMIDDNGQCLKIRHLRVGDFPITGLAAVSTEKLIVTTQDSKIYTTKVSENEDLSCKMVKNDLKSTKVQYLGLANSRNATIFVNVTSPDGIYDHLINREPSTLQIFYFTGDDLNPWKMIDTSNGNEKISLYKYWDCLESIRVRSARSSEATKEFSEIPHSLENLSIHKLRTVMWLTLISRVLDKKQMLKGVQKIVGEISEAQPLIFLLSACEHLRRMANKKNLTINEKRCVSFLRMYLEIYEVRDDDDEDNSDGNEISRKITEALRSTSHVNSIEVEACNICEEIITDLPWTVDSCPAGHKLLRCSLTLLQIDSVRYRICPICDRLYHPSLDDDYRHIRCIYCDIPAQYDSRIINDVPDFEKRWNNLSKRRANNSETKISDNDNTNAVTTSFNGKVKKRGINPHTFAVIVNKDDGDSCITETWQEF